jgi:hypothetical protein
MTPEKKAKIEELAEVSRKARDKFMALGMLNIMGRTADQRVEMSKEYAVAEAEMLEADANLKAAQQP